MNNNITQFQLVRGDSASNDAYTGKPAELTVNTNDWTLRVHDGTTLGGHEISGGGSSVSSSYAMTASVASNGIITASAAASTITFTKGDGSTFSVTVAQSGSVESSSYATTAQSAVSSSYATTASYVLNTISASYATTASRAISSEKVDVLSGGSTTGLGIYSGSFYGTSSWATTASFALNAAAGTGFPFIGDAAITGSLSISGSGAFLNLISRGPAILTIEADTDNVTETDNPRIILKQDGGGVVSRIGYVNNDNKLEIVNEFNDGLNFGTNNTTQMAILSTGNVGIGTITPGNKLSVQGTVSASNFTSSVANGVGYLGTASRAVIGEQVEVLSGGSTTGLGIYSGSFFGTSSWAISSSQALTASYALNAATGVGFPFSGSAIITGSLLVSGSGINVTGSLNVTQGVTGSLLGTSSWAASSSRALTASFVLPSGLPAGTISSSLQLNSLTNPITGSFTGSLIGSLTGTASRAVSASRADSSEKVDVLSGGSTTGLGIYSGSFFGTSSWAVSSSNALTASYALNAASGAGFPFSGSAVITGSLLISGSGLLVTGSASFRDNLLVNGGTLFADAVNNRVGIGTTTPGNTLHVQGTISASAIQLANAAIGTLISNGNGNPILRRLTVNGGLSLGTDDVLILGAGESRATIESSVATGSEVAWLGAEDGVNLVTSPDNWASGWAARNQVTFTNTGRLGVGTTSPGNTLHVQGNVSASAYTSSINNGVGFLGTSSWAVSSSRAISTSRADSSEKVDVLSGGSTTGLGIYSGSFFGTSSYAITASYALNAATAGATFPFSGIAVITGSLVVSSSGINVIGNGITGSLTGSLVGSLIGTSSWAVTASNAITSSYVLPTGQVVQTFTNGVDNRVLTALSTTGINGEANLTFDGNQLSVTGTASFNRGIANGNIDLQVSSTTKGVLSAIAWHDSVALSTNLRYTGSTDPTTTPGNWQYIQASGSNNIAGITAFMKGNGGEAGTYFSVLTTPSSSGVSGTVTAITERMRVGGDGVLTVNATGIIRTGTGSLTTPAFATHNDTNTGIYFPAADTIGFVEGGVEAMRIDSSGRVGINKTNPVTPLDVSGSIRIEPGSLDILHNTSTVLQLRNSALTVDARQWSVRVDTGELTVRATTDVNATQTTPLTLYRTGTASFSGNVGIGTIAPSQRLDVSGSVNVRSASPTVFFDRNGAYTWRIANGDGTTYPLSSFNVANNAGTAAITVTSTNNVGIGTTVPGTTLHVQGNISASSYTSSINNAVGYFGTASWSVSSSRTISASRADSSEKVDVLSGGSTTGLGIYSGSFFGTASYATTASYALNAATAGAAFPFTGVAIITGSLVVSSSGINVIGNGVTASVLGTSSWATNAVTATTATQVANALTAGNGLASAGTFTGATARTFSVDTSSAHFISGSRLGINVLSTAGASGINLSYNTSSGTISGSLVNNNVQVLTSDGLGGGGTITLGGSATLTLLTSSGHFVSGTRAALPTGLVSSSAQVTYSGLTGIPTGIVSSSSQLNSLTGPITGSFTGSLVGTLTGTASWAQSSSRATIATDVEGAANSILYNRATNDTATTASLTFSDTSQNMSLTVGSGTQASGSFIRLNAPAGQYTQFAFRTGTQDRWVIYRDNTAESGAQNGSQFRIASYNDSGVFQDNPISINRPTGSSISTTRPLQGITGSVSTPSFGPSTDTNTGIYFPDADTIGFVEGGVEAMRIDSSGRVGIGTTSASVTLHVNGIISGSSISGSGNMTLGGSATATNFILSSDIRLKENLVPIPSPLSKVTNITGNTFNFIGKSESISGVIAQEVQKVLPEAVVTMNNGYLGVSYDQLVPLLIEAIKELNNKVDRLQSGSRDCKCHTT